MALSKPQSGIQTPVQCQLCEKDPKISWKCLECDLLMCSACKNNIHPKFKSAGEHRIISIKDIGSKSSPGKYIGCSSPSSMDSANVDITLVKEYQTELEMIVHLAISLDDTLWISEGKHKKGIRLFSSHTAMQNAKCERNKPKVISSFNIDVFGIAITLGNDLLIATKGPILKQIKSETNKIVETVHNLHPYQPFSIHVTRYNKVIVGALKNAVFYTEDNGIVIAMDHEGKHEKVYGEDQTKGISFTEPIRITGTNNEHIFVVDILNDQSEGRELVVLKQGDIINTYSGHPVINTEDRPFKPIDLTTTPADNVIVANADNYDLYILNSSGILITYIDTKIKGVVQDLLSIKIAMSGQFVMLYLGTTNDEERKDKAKLYKLNLVGC
ncbi:uncharacterized protein [Mytilus edulis]|uniref:uncharacterized protein n=1 Tax=Mytilus edulis TaxID=6550 RepID=UPI0039F10DEA